LGLRHHRLLERLRAMAQILDKRPVLFLQRTRHRERQLRERRLLLLDVMEVLLRHHGLQEHLCSPEVQVAIDRVYAPHFDDRGDDGDRILVHTSPQARPTTCCVCRAIMSSSLVGITHARTRLGPVLMRGPPRALAAASSSTPSHAAPWHTRSRMTAAFSPIPPVNTIASSPPSAAASEPSSRPMRYT